MRSWSGWWSQSVPESNKCIFMAKSVSYLGHRIDADGLHPLLDKVAAVLEVPLPQDVAQMKSYLGLLSYYSQFLPNLSMVVAPLKIAVYVSAMAMDRQRRGLDCLITSFGSF